MTNPAVLRLSYVADKEDSGLVKRRVDAVKRKLSEVRDPAIGYVIAVETEVFWRRGRPAKQSEVRAQESK